MKFVYSRYNADGKQVEYGKSINIPIQNGVTIQDFYYYIDPSTFNLNPGEKVDYYFQVSDNDGVNGHKSSKSIVSTFRLRTMEEIDKDLDKAEKQTKADYNDLIDQSSKLMKDIEKLQTQMLQEKEMSWQDKKKLEQLMDQYRKLEEQVNQLKQQQENQQNLESQYKDIDSDIIKKEKELQKRMDQVLSDEMKQMMQKIQEMMKSNPNQTQNQMNKMKQSAKDINKTLDQQLQLYKQLELEKKVNEAVQDLQNLSDELKKNAQKTNDRQSNKEGVLQKQNEIQQKFNE